jgi:hypothetical protein
MQISQRYASARSATNLASDPRTSMSASDVLGAVGMAGQANPEAVALLNSAFGGKTSAKLAFVELLEHRLQHQMLRERWKGNPRQIAQEAVAWWLHGTCQPCSGRGYELINGTPSLGHICKHCNATGRILAPREPAFLWLIDLIERLVSVAEGETRKKLAH